MNESDTTTRPDAQTLTATDLEPGDELRDTEGHGRTNTAPHSPDYTPNIVVKKPWRGDAWLFGVRIENGRIGGGGSGSFAVSYEEIDTRLASGRYEPVDCEAHRHIDTDALPVDADEDLYVRFGDLPEGGRSTNHIDGSEESGASVYAASIESVLPAVDEPAMVVPHGPKSLQIILLATRDTYLVRGDENGRGVDGEPVLKNAEIVAPLAYQSDAGGWVIKEDDS